MAVGIKSDNVRCFDHVEFRKLILSSRNFIIFDCMIKVHLQIENLMRHLLLSK